MIFTTVLPFSIVSKLDFDDHFFCSRHYVFQFKFENFTETKQATALYSYVHSRY
jgi:hypothetical protein